MAKPPKSGNSQDGRFYNRGPHDWRRPPSRKLTAREKATVRAALYKIARAVGGAAKLIEIMGISPQTWELWKYKKMGAQAAIELERIALLHNLEVTRYDLAPHHFKKPPPIMKMGCGRLITGYD